MPAEIARKKQEVEKLTGFIAAKEKKLGNASFVERAPAEVVQKGARQPQGSFKTSLPPRGKCWSDWRQNN